MPAVLAPSPIREIVRSASRPDFPKSGLAWSRNKDHPMIIGFIGAGNVAQAIARCALAQGHKVIIGSRRGPQALVETVAKFGSTDARAGTLADAASADMVVLAVPWPEAERALADAPAWNGRILVDATNSFAS
jgi:8-hydroxy-5-deazaflavin:NADPH oxidoreductase